MTMYVYVKNVTYRASFTTASVQSYSELYIYLAANCAPHVWIFIPTHRGHTEAWQMSLYTGGTPQMCRKIWNLKNTIGRYKPPITQDGIVCTDRTEKTWWLCMDLLALLRFKRKLRSTSGTLGSSPLPKTWGKVPRALKQESGEPPQPEAPREVHPCNIFWGPPLVPF